MAAPIELEDGTTKDGEPIVGTRYRKLMTWVLFLLGGILATQAGLVYTVGAHLSPESLGHETLEEYTERIEAEAAAKALTEKRNSDWDGWRGQQDLDAKENERFRMEQRAFNRILNADAANEAAAIAEEESD